MKRFHSPLHREKRRDYSVLLSAIILSLLLMPSYSHNLSFSQASDYADEEYGIDLDIAWKSHDFKSDFKHASATIADIDGDGLKEILIGNKNGILYCITWEGKLKWLYETDGAIEGKPAAHDVNGDGQLEIFFGSGDGHVHGLNSKGAPLIEWGWPQFAGDGYAGATQNVFASPAIGDITGDGKAEIVVGGYGRMVFAWHYDRGLVDGWPFDNRDSIWSSPAVADLDGDGVAEIIIGADCYGNRLDPEEWYPPGGLLWVFNGDGTIRDGWPKALPQVIWSSPAVADITGNGYLDIVVGTGHYWQNSDPSRPTYLSYADGAQVFAFDLWGEPLPGWPVRTYGDNFASPAIADITGDGRLEVINASNDGYVRCWKHDGTLMWKDRKYDCATLSSPVVADIDGNGLMNIIVGHSTDLCIWDARGNLLFDQNLGGIVFGTAAVDDLNNDGFLEIVIATGAAESLDASRVYIFKGGALTRNVERQVPWSMFRRTSDNRAGYCLWDFPDPPEAWPEDEIKSRWYLAEGYTSNSFDTWVLMMNPLDREMHVQVRFLRSNMPSTTRLYKLKPKSRSTVFVNNYIKGDVSVVVTSNEEGLVVERAMYFDYNGIRDGSCSIGVKEPASVWYLAEGSTQRGFDEYLLLMNTDMDRNAKISVTYMTANGPVDSGVHEVGNRMRRTIHVNSALPDSDVSILVRSLNEVPVVAERAMYFEYMNDIRGGHSTIGVTKPEKDWYFAEGYTAEEFDTYVLVQNPNNAAASCTARFMRDDGKLIEVPFTIGAQSRFTISPDSIEGLEEASFAIHITSDSPVISERAMYFRYMGVIDGGHVTIGATSASAKWLFAEGYTAQSYDTWILLQNPNDYPVSVNADFMKNDGSVTKHRVDLKPLSRGTICVDFVPGLDACEVATKIYTDDESGIVAERAMYFISNGRAGGHITIGHAE